MIKFDYVPSYRKGKIICDDDTLKMIRNHFSEKIANIAFIKKQTGNNFISDRAYAVQKTGMFDFGLHQEIQDFLISKQITDIEFTEEFVKHSGCGFGVETVFDGLAYGNRYYGLDAVSKALEVGSGTIVVGTGGGKSYLTASILENIYRSRSSSLKCLIIVPGLSLVTQLLDNFQEYGVSFTYSGWTGETDLQDTNIIICNSENFCAKFDANKKWIINVDVVIGDECHRTKSSNQISKHIAKIITLNKFGFTGTLPPQKIDRWKVIGTFGPVIYEKSSKELRDEGFLTDASIKIIKLHHRSKPIRGYRNELKFLYNSVERNNILKKVVTKLNNNVLILVNHLEHGENLLECFKIDGKDTFFVKGETAIEDRLKIVGSMETQTNIVCIAMSSIFSTGIDIKNLHYILFVAGGKSFIRTIQSIGRGLRLHSSKNKLVLLDFYDNMKSSMEHIEERKKFYDSEQINWSETEVNL